jgi:biopolymer transport protein ExbD
MAIHVPGLRTRRGRAGGRKRSVVAALSLTAMVDLFTVLVVFLLQNYATTGEVIEIPENVELPQAREVKDLKPANIVIVSDRGVQLNNTILMDFESLKAQTDWSIEPLRAGIEKLIEDGEKEKATIGSRIKIAVDKVQSGKSGDKVEEELDKFRRITIQADKKIDFLTLKKVMYTVTEAGALQISFAVMKNSEEKKL